MSLGVRLKELRIKKGKSLQEVADAVGASKAHVWDMETGRSKNPSIELLLKLAKFFGVGIADLVGENPNAEEEGSRALSMYRELKELKDEDLEFIQQMMDRLKDKG
ncbi:MAG: helix-turn-helix domain-containing protein [Hyphomicrobium sp.]|nr:helix-turn-helix domain-containing protein [Hyphomicrobium sp.]